MTGNGVMHNGTTILDEYGHNLDRLKVSFAAWLKHFKHVNFQVAFQIGIEKENYGKKYVNYGKTFTKLFIQHIHSDYLWCTKIWQKKTFGWNRRKLHFWFWPKSLSFGAKIIVWNTCRLVSAFYVHNMGKQKPVNIPAVCIHHNQKRILD